MTAKDLQNEQPPLLAETGRGVKESARTKRIFLIAGCAGICVIFLLWLLGSRLYREITSVVEVTIRRSLVLDKTAVVRLRNTSREIISGVVVQFRSRTTGEAATAAVGMIAPDETKELGILQCRWTLQPNEEFTVKADGFRSATFRTYAGDHGQVSLSP